MFLFRNRRRLYEFVWFLYGRPGFSQSQLNRSTVRSLKFDCLNYGGDVMMEWYAMLKKYDVMIYRYDAMLWFIDMFGGPGDYGSRKVTCDHVRSWSTKNVAKLLKFIRFCYVNMMNLMKFTKPSRKTGLPSCFSDPPFHSLLPRLLWQTKLSRTSDEKQNAPIHRTVHNFRPKCSRDWYGSTIWTQKTRKGRKWHLRNCHQFKGSLADSSTLSRCETQTAWDIS